ncbi:NAD(P)H-dependent oxidoreductase [Rhizobium sp. EC-SD404]|uniref:NADPH-dependent FMN reductase n=1 Tax=Rhizobium sp. EC-SD404 TaxID=2038389 RepID=UPI00125AFB18|nr:NAD(P)H-dependent oxidoreductase [Rhizobium sp. EC-SD404]VVT06963.1 Flavodoxin-like fold family protein [Rhizobium sp. EC-SD404]
MSKLKIAVVIGSTREGRFAEKPAHWIADLAKSDGAFDVEMIDLKDYPMAFYGDPAATEAQSETAAKFKAKVQEFDAYIFTAAEYNHAPTAVLKNAIDHGAWVRKPVAFVGYGGVGGARAVEQLRQIAVEMEMASVKTGTHILFPEYLAIVKGEKQISDFAHLVDAAKTMLGQLAWWGKALKSARDEEANVSLAKAS